MAETISAGPTTSGPGVAMLPTAVRWAALGVLGVFVAAGVLRRLPEHPLLAWIPAVIAIAAGAVLVLQRRRTLLPAAAIVTAAVSVLGNGTSSNVSWFAVCVVGGWTALTASVPMIAFYWVGASATLVVEALVSDPDPGWLAWIGGTTFTVIGCMFGRRQHELVVQLREAQAGLAERAQTEERGRIARELHDVIAHSLTVSLLHVSAARLAVADDPAEAAHALAEAERLGRASLDEVRHAVGLLHREGSPDPTAPLPGSTDVPALLEGFRAAGADVRAQVDTDLAALPATVGLTAYRILQEALTNAAKHAPAARVEVRVETVQGQVRIEVDSAGRPGQGSGHGLLGMRERAASLGGTVRAGAGGRGWLVHAELPLSSAAGGSSPAGGSPAAGESPPAGRSAP